MAQGLMNFFSSPINITYIVFILLGIILIVYGLLDRAISRRKTVLKSISNEELHPSLMDKILDSIQFIKKGEEKLDKQISVLDVNYSARSLTKYKIVSGFAGILLSIYFQNWLVVIPIVIIFINIPTTFVEFKVKKKVRLFNDQILESFQIFVTDYTTSQSVQKTIVNICPKLKYPIRKEFERLARKLNSGEAAEQCFIEFATRTQNKWTLIFAQIMITYFRNGGDFTNHLMNITKSITDEKILAEQNNTELSSLRMVNIVMNALVPIAYMSNRFINPADARVFIETSTGRTIMFVVVLCVFFSLYIGKKITEA